MKKILFITLAISFIVSLLVHALIIADIGLNIKSGKTHENIQKPHNISEVKFVKLTPSEPIASQKETKTLEKEESKPKKEITKEKVETKELKEAKSFQEKILKESSKLQEQTLENFLSQKDTIYNSEVFNELKELYGKEYDDFTTVQKAYLEKNINNFQIITQRVLNRLGYPHEAVRLKITGINIVEFIFHPNGDISDLRIIQSSGYSILDNRTLELIQIAYKEYPKPQTPTLLRFKVFYRLY
ncbi:energy transducer TonB [Aliarcobacter skirrowii]|uniref:energy transducer TonB n=1 Tax=Aliarcobacter skirrowii TaxID=28200 RepID=UPI0029A64FE9|nr:energy transducer TonB [Aliarcobacter skirrowii]MDX4060009.1 energy transducer TonB [Aliarcobacter skirrowii]